LLEISDILNLLKCSSFVSPNCKSWSFF